MTPFEDPQVQAVFDTFPEEARNALMRVRQMIFDTAVKTDGVGSIDECLKWGEPSYITVKPRSGSTIRIGWKPDMPDHGNVFFNCRTSLISDMRERYPEKFRFEGNRRLLFRLDEPLPKDALRHCFALALTYHKRKKEP